MNKITHSWRVFRAPILLLNKYIFNKTKRSTRSGIKLLDCQSYFSRSSGSLDEENVIRSESFELSVMLH